jgi:hypothetical protein
MPGANHGLREISLTLKFLSAPRRKLLVVGRHAAQEFLGVAFRV